MTDKDIKYAVKHCEWLSNNHYSVGEGKLHKGICTSEGSVCSLVIDRGDCPILQDLFRKDVEP